MTMHLPSSAYRVKPQLKTLGPRYGKLLPKINQYLAGEGVGNAVVAAHNRGESYKFDIDGTEISLAAEDVLVSHRGRTTASCTVTEQRPHRGIGYQPDAGAASRRAS